MKLHQKAFLLVTFSRVTDAWDYQIIPAVLAEYGLSGGYWENNLRVALDELAAAGLISRIDQKLETIAGKPRLLFHYRLSDFGRSRMLDTGLLSAGQENGIGQKNVIEQKHE